MPSILTRKSVRETLNSCSTVLQASFENIYIGKTTVVDRFELSFQDFFADFVGSVAYRAEHGVDGNWTEFVNDWKIPAPDFHYNAVLAAMKSNGFKVGLHRW